MIDYMSLIVDGQMTCSSQASRNVNVLSWCPRAAAFASKMAVSRCLTWILRRRQRSRHRMHSQWQCSLTAPRAALLFVTRFAVLTELGS